EVGPVGGHLDRSRVAALEDDRLASVDLVHTDDFARAGREDVLAVARRMEERLRQRLHRQGGQRAVDTGRPGQSGVLVREHADDRAPNGPLRAEPERAAPPAPRGARSVRSRCVPLYVRTVWPSEIQTSYVPRAAPPGTDVVTRA